MDFLIHWPPGPVVATVQCQGLFQKSVIKVDSHIVDDLAVASVTFVVWKNCIGKTKKTKNTTG